MPKLKRPIAVDVFSGVGGMSLGMEQAGFDVVSAFDFEKRHIETYKLNFPDCHAHVLDLSKASGKKVRKLSNIGNRSIDLLFGGPPCQGFSTGGKRELEDPRNLMVFHFARLVRELKPKYFILENVEGLLHGHTLEIVKSFKRRIRLAGYEVVDDVRALVASDYGVPQKRRRAFIVGFRKQLPALNYPERTGIVDENGNEYFPTVRDAISDLPTVEKFDELFKKDDVICELGIPTHYAKLMRSELVESTDKSRRHSPKQRLTGCLRTHHSVETIKRFRKTKPGCQEPISRYYRLKLDGYAPTIRAGTGIDHGKHTAPRPIHPLKPRCITAREAARLHSFPDWFCFHPTKWHAFRQIGNSVPPRMARFVGIQILKSINSMRS